MSFQRKNHRNSAGTGLSAVSARSSALTGIRAPPSQNDDASSVSSSVGFVVPVGRYNPFITQNLRNLRNTKSGKLSLNICVGSRLAAIERYKSKLSEVSRCALYFNPEEESAKNYITIIADNIDRMVTGIDTISNINTRLKTHGVAMETRVIPLPKISNILPVITLTESVTTHETPLVSCSLGHDSIRVTGPTSQLDAVMATLNQGIELLAPKPKHIPSKPASVSTSVSASAKPLAIFNLAEKEDSTKVSTKVSSIDAYTRAYIQRMEREAELEADAEDSDDLITSTATATTSDICEDDTVPAKMSNRMVKPPSKAESARMKAASCGVIRKSNISDYDVDEDQVYCVITKLDGGNKVVVKVISKDDVLFKTECRARISGSMTRRGNKAGKGKKLRSSNHIATGQVVIASKRDFDAKWLDVIKKVPDDIVQRLIRGGQIPMSYYDNPYGKNETYDEENDCGFVFSNGDGEDVSDGGYDEIDFDSL